ncbi:MAG: choice-of-anchor J domain-containing protein [Bacteroidota bacterium]|nr:choice-of-anchor J domain-containing protein [Bacteroidota bacterium]
MNARSVYIIIALLLLTASPPALPELRRASMLPQAAVKQKILRDASTIHSKHSASVPIIKIPLSIQSTQKQLLSPTSTIIFQESFEGGTGFPPAGWMTVNADGGGTTGPWFQGNTTILTAYSGNGYAAANYQGANDFYIDEWLISPQLQSISSGDTLTFWNRSPDFSAWADSVEVRISTTNTELSSFTILVDYFKTSTNGWEQKRYPLKNYVPSGSSIYVAFRYIIYNGGISGLSSDYVGLDLVQVVRPKVLDDIAVISIDYPFNGSKVLLGESIDPLVSFQNAGSTAQINIPVRLRIIPPSGTVYENNQIISSLNVEQTAQVEFSSYTPTVWGQYSIIAYSFLSGDQNNGNDSLTSNFSGAVLVSGTFTVGSGGNIPTLKKAVDTLNHNIISNDITLSLISSTYSEPPLVIGPLDYTYNLIRRIIIKPSAGISPIVNINSTSTEPFGIAIYGTSKVTINGSNSSMNNRNATINALGINGKIGVLISGTEESFADSNVVKNINVRTAADSLLSAEGFYGVLLYGYNSTYKDAGNRISNCDITKHGMAGIAGQWQTGTVIENNFIHDWTQKSGSNDVWGIWLAEGTINARVSGNVIGNINNEVNYYWACGIENSSGAGSNAWVFNNFIYRILSSGAGSNVNYSRGIYSGDIANSGDRYYFNSIYLEGTDNSTSISSHTSGFEFLGGSNIIMKNNIVFNQTNLTGASTDNKAYCIYLSSVPADFASNNNDLFAPNSKGVVGYNSGNRVTIADWRASFSPTQDAASISANPLFVSPSSGNLHIQTAVTSPVNAAGIPITGITSDIDGMTRHPITPDIGADEFIPGAVSISIAYDEGWNLISVPLIVDDYNKIILYPTAISEAFAYNGSYIITETLENGKGYWLKFGAAQNLELAGDSLASDTIDVAAGWNMIGALTSSVAVDSIIQVPADIVVSKFFMYDGTYTNADTLSPGRGYWVKVKQNGKLIMRLP